MNALVVSNNGGDIKIIIKFYVPTQILNLRVTGEH